MKVAHKLGPLAVLFIIFTLAVPGSSAFAQNESHTEEDKIIAAYVYTLSKFVTWPTELSGVLKLAVTREEGGCTGNFKYLEGKTVNNSTIQVEVLDTLSVSGDFHLLYISETQEEKMETILANVSGKPVLTISKSDKFCENGGMICLVERRGKIRFKINLGAAKAAGLTINSQVLKLAIKVIN